MKEEAQFEVEITLKSVGQFWDSVSMAESQFSKSEPGDWDYSVARRALILTKAGAETMENALKISGIQYDRKELE